MANLTSCYKGGASGRPGWVIQFAYNAEVVESLKAAIPHVDREWRPESKEWWVSEDYQEQLKALFGNFEALALWQGRLL